MMELTITQNGALYALQHGATKKNRRARRKRTGADLIRVLPTLSTSTESVRYGQVRQETLSPPPDYSRAQIADAFPEDRAAA
jgi:hypothetical protein